MNNTEGKKLYTLEEAHSLVKQKGKKYNMEESDVNEILGAVTDVKGIDDKTGLLNTRRFIEEFGEVIGWHMRKGKEDELAFWEGDLDLFKKFNETYGQVLGDRLITETAYIIEGYANRPFEHAGRIGGEEYALTLAQKKEQALKTAENIRSAVEKHRINNNSKRGSKKRIGATITGIVSSLSDDKIYRAMKVVYGKNFAELLGARIEAGGGKSNDYRKLLREFSEKTGVSETEIKDILDKSVGNLQHFRVDYKIKKPGRDLLESKAYKTDVRNYIGARNYIDIPDSKLKDEKTMNNNRNVVLTL